MCDYGIIPWIYFINIFLILQVNSCFPVDKDNADTQPVLKDEVRYPNGTVVGKYSYVDNEGNPINVKYYADHSSYGVELNSFKTFKVTDSNTTKEALHQSKYTVDYMKPIKPLVDLASEIISFSNRHTEKPDVSTLKNVAKVSQLAPAGKIAKVSSPDYETFYQNEVKAPKQCTKDKVKVYLVKEKRKIQSALGEEQTGNFCRKP